MENITAQTEQTTSTEATTAQTTDTTQSATTETAIATSFANGKYDSVSALEKGYTELHSKFGSFSGSPEAYTLAEGTEINNEHPILSDLQSFGKENNLSNEGYEKLVNVLLNNERADAEAQEAQVVQVKKDLGANANERIQNIDDFVNANMQANDDMKGLIDQAKDMPGGVELIEAFIGMSKKTTPASEQVVAPIKTYNKDELHKMQFAKDEYGSRKMNDATYRKQVESYSAALIAQG